MAPARTNYAVLALLLLLGAQASPAAAQAAPAAASGCALKDFTRVDWSSAKPACSLDQASAPAPQAFCDACICAVGTALATGLEAAGVQVDGQPIGSLVAAAPANGTDISNGAVAALLDACAPVLGLQLLNSGALSSSALEALAKCDARAAGRSCYAAAVATENGGSASPRVLAAGTPTPSAAPAAPAPARSSACASAVAALSSLAAMLLAAVML